MENKAENPVANNDQESIVYGIIRDLPADDENVILRRRVNNQAALSALDDPSFSFLCPEIFALPGEDIFSGTYMTQVIHFAASYRAVEYEWEIWVKEFEALLKRMYWMTATVHLETELSGKHTFHWESTQDGHKPDQGDFKVRCEWEREAQFSPKT